MGRVAKGEASGFDLIRDWMNKRVGVHFEIPDLYYMEVGLTEATIRKLVRWLMCAGFISRESRGYYRIEKHISTKINTTELEKLAYPNRRNFYKPVFRIKY
jgi:hypothetical protein|uniref:Ethanolamine utilization protein n=1 Tax=Siphoviridae sp. ctxc31 TaxID=2826520 RepID=A0A8S5MMT3_9CAUD|nr:MAG TPA: ethanolamine utilization protein [Siphoviridae sp. ctxc31]